MNEFELFKTLVDEFKTSIILNERATDDDRSETFEDVVETAQELHGALEKFIKDNR